MDPLCNNVKNKKETINLRTRDDLHTYVRTSRVEVSRLNLRESLFNISTATSSIGLIQNWRTTRWVVGEIACLLTLTPLSLMYVCTYVHICVYMCIYARARACVCVCVCVRTYVRTYVDIDSRSTIRIRVYCRYVLCT